jgi:FkbM family methyltransferase
MLIDFRQLFPRWNIKPTGVLHIGANVGEEAPVYHELGIKKVIWIEGNPELMPRLIENVSRYPGQKAHNFLIGDSKGAAVLHISNNASQSSSVLDLGTHKIAHPEVHYVKDIPMEMRRIDDLFKDGIGAEYDFLNIDLQGAELMALRGMGEILKQFKWAYLEVNKAELYKGCPLVEDLDLYLLGFGLRRVETSWAGNSGWGDALWVKQ